MEDTVNGILVEKERTADGSRANMRSNEVLIRIMMIDSCRLIDDIMRTGQTRTLERGRKFVWMIVHRVGRICVLEY